MSPLRYAVAPLANLGGEFWGIGGDKLTIEDQRLVARHPNGTVPKSVK